MKREVVPERDVDGGRRVLSLVRVRDLRIRSENAGAGQAGEKGKPDPLRKKWTFGYR